MIEVSWAIAMLSWLSTIRRSSVVPDPIGPTMKIGFCPVGPPVAGVSATVGSSESGSVLDSARSTIRNPVRAGQSRMERGRRGAPEVEGRHMPRLSIVLVDPP